MEENTKKINVLLEIQQALNVPKNHRNNFGNYNYRNCEDILEAVKPLLKEYGATLIITDEIVVLGEGNPIVETMTESFKENNKTVFQDIRKPIGGARFYVKATATLAYGEYREIVSAYAREEETKKGMDGSQITGSASSYARKYALNGLFAIDDSKDADSEDNTTQARKVSQNEPQKPIAHIQKGIERLRNGEKPLATEKQIKAVWEIGNKMGWDDNKLHEGFKVSTLNDITFEQARQFIEKYGSKS